tara:strand:- start:386 stop:781 length:396 start_codon:yes stop_codon:yes gene_type:complete
MPGYAPRLPLALDKIDGFTLVKDFQALTRQNLKMLVLTNPGERVMVPDFGVGIRHMLFEQAGTRIGERIQERVFSQVREFMPHITIYNVDVSMGDDILSEAHSMLVRINYSIPSLEIMDQLTFDLTSVELG